MHLFLDLLISAVVIWGLVHGFRKGFILQAVAIVALLLGTWGALVFAERFESTVAGWGSSPAVVPAVSFVLVFLAVLALVLLLAHIVNGLIQLTPLGLLNRIAGAFLGFCTGLLVASVLIAVLNKMDSYGHFMPKSALEKSSLYRPVGKVAPFIYPHLHFDRVEEWFQKKRKSS